jgi:hypothetical protein
MPKRYQVIIKTRLEDRPKDHEMAASLILANNYFKSDVTFLRPEPKKTPDIEVKGVRWEIKSPIDSGKKTMDNNLRTARKQSDRVVVDFSRLKLHQTRAISRINHYLKTGPHKFKQVVIITKDKKVLEIL